MNPALLFSHPADERPVDIEQKLVFAVTECEADVKVACQQASHHRLAVPGWTFFEIFRAGISGDISEYKIEAVSSVFSGQSGNPLGVAVAFHAWGDFNAGCFVRAPFRRMRLGSRLITKLKEGVNFKPFRIHDGVKGSQQFWEAMGANENNYIETTKSFPIRA